MTLQRNLVWQRLDHLYRSSVTYQYARYALGLNYGMLPQEVIHQAKRCLLDNLGCAIGGYEVPGRLMCETMVRQLGGKEEATVFCSGLRTTALNATLVNSFLLKFLEFNDLGGGGHNGDAIPAILAIAERERASGADFLLSVVISYELGARIIGSFVGKSLGARGWSGDMRGGLSMPPALGKLMKLNEDQIANAIGICASGSLPLKILDADREENTMRNHLRFGWVAYDAILSCLLAQQGFTGPIRIIEGDNGWRQVLVNGDIDLENMVDFSGWRILATRHKSLPGNGPTTGHVQATIDIVKEQDLKPEDIALVLIKTCAQDFRHTTTPAKKYPRNAESADHSAFYNHAIAIKERHFSADSVEPQKFTDPVVLGLIERIRIEIDPDLPNHSYQSTTEITTVDGRKFQKHVVSPHGYVDDPLTDSELEEKFRKMATRYMDEKQIKQIFNIIWNIENYDNVSQLMKLMVFKSR
ncbi:MmgE/PrpD family protein [Chloroflexota bacterium]